MFRRWILVVMLMIATGACTTSSAKRAAPVATLVLPTSTIPRLAPDVQDLMAGTTMTALGRRIFLRTEPAIEDLATFTRSCAVVMHPDPDGKSSTRTQGCYVNGHIYLLSPDRAVAHDLLYVVAAHELLHAVYDSLSPPERNKIDTEVEAARVGNERLEDHLKAYSSLAGATTQYPIFGATATIDNEIHSILGSEFAGLSPILEAHYAQYFANRAVLVADRQRILGAREDEIRRLKTSIDDYQGRIRVLRSGQEARLRAGDIATYNSKVAAINDLISRSNAQVDQLKALVDEYNGLLGAA